MQLDVLETVIANRAGHQPCQTAHQHKPDKSPAPVIERFREGVHGGGAAAPKVAKAWLVLGITFNLGLRMYAIPMTHVADNLMSSFLPWKWDAAKAPRIAGRPSTAGRMCGMIQGSTALAVSAPSIRY